MADDGKSADFLSLGKNLANLKVKSSTKALDILPFYFDETDEYDMSHKRRGVAIIVVCDTFKGRSKREGCDIDSKKLQELFRFLGFEVRYLHNATRESLFQALKRVSKEDHSDNDCFAMAVSTHGDEYVFPTKNVREDVIYLTDHVVPITQILEFLRDKNCKTLQRKPKFFFFQACRGDNLDAGLGLTVTRPVDRNKVLSPGNLEESPDHLLTTQSNSDIDAIPELNWSSAQTRVSKQNLTQRNTQGAIGIQAHSKQPLANPVVTPAPCYKDFLVMYATPPGYFAFRNPNDGSWFIQCLHRVLIHSTGLLSLTRQLTRVVGQMAREFESRNFSNANIHEKKQTPVIYSMLTKDVYLKPKC